MNTKIAIDIVCIMFCFLASLTLLLGAMLAFRYMLLLIKHWNDPDWDK